MAKDKMTIEDLARMVNTGFNDLSKDMNQRFDNVHIEMNQRFDENQEEHEEMRGQMHDIETTLSRVEKIQTVEVKRADNISVRVGRLEKTAS